MMFGDGLKKHLAEKPLVCSWCGERTSSLPDGRNCPECAELLRDKTDEDYPPADVKKK